MKLHIRESGSISKHYDWIKQCFERNDIPMNLLNHVVEVNNRFYIDMDLAEAKDFNSNPNYCDEWRVEAETIESPYYNHYHFSLFHIINNDREFPEACFMTIEEVKDYVDQYIQEEEHFKNVDIDW